MSEQVQFDLHYKVDGKETVCGFREMSDGSGEKYFLLCVTIGDYTKEYELRFKPDADSCKYQFVTPDVPEDLMRHECEINEAIVQYFPDSN